MCGRYVAPDDAAIERHYRVDRRTPAPFIRRFNVAPTAIVPVLREAPDGAMELLAARWGLVPHWWKQARLPTLSFNARSEEAASKPMWREALRFSRCLMPAEGWYEWQERDPSSGQPLAVRKPHFIHARDDSVVAFAGLLASWTTPAGEPLLSCALLSKAAAASVSEVHDRMPVVLAPAHHAAWLSAGVTDADAVAGMIAQAATDFVHYAVSTRVNNARNESPELLAPLAPSGTPPFSLTDPSWQ